ncbi:uncharacterized protein (DUF58 family) [Allocatelliglobosispora scoriae]|uniref:Uncharacterized protein (DUF58 family) n=1 Tax=Allocatelliglobosispora scoriae TaxID=643052 RepID=A0A841BNF3_9ACTN|nr:DUF58 domain-containing protein [Allocatelliglobosispora scoriae]MBB5869205.1 uncharacterized protein (DUF58 family) [Allocatelliglobosispora scoriae]
MTVTSSGVSASLSRLQLQVTRRLDGLLQGEYLGLLPGPGSEAGESREYRPGDDVRRMDWPVTARTTVPHVRLTEADRELETWLAVDASASLDFGTGTMLKRELALAAAAAMTHLTVRGGNRIGALVGTGDAPVVRIPARGGRRGAQALLHRIARIQDDPGPHPAQGASGIGELLDGLARPPRRRGLVVVISDFLSPVAGWERPLKRLRVRHDLLAIEIVDPRELELPPVGVVEFVDAETGRVHTVQTSDPKLRTRYAKAAAAQRDEIADALRGAGAVRLRLRTDSDWLMDMVRFVVGRRHLRDRGSTR